MHIALVCGQHLDLLLHLGDGTALLVGPGLRPVQRLLHSRQLALLLFGLCLQQSGAFFVFIGLGLQTGKLSCRIVLTRGPLGSLCLELLQPLLYAHPALDHKADFSLQPTHLRAGLIQQTLGLADLVTCRVMRLTNGFQVGLQMTQVCHTAFQIVHGFVGILLDPALIGFTVSTL